MRLKIIQKSAASTRGLNQIMWECHAQIKNVADLISALVHREIDRFESDGKAELTAHSQADIDAMLKVGKVSFGFRYREDTGSIDRKHAIDVAKLAYKDQLFSLFINNEELHSLEQAITLHQDDEITLIRLVMLAGRYY